AIEKCMMSGVDATACELGWTKSNLLVGASASATTDQTGLVVSYDLATGAGSIAATFGQNASSAISTKTLTWTRAANDATAPGTWTCETTVEAKYAPAGCPVAATTN